MNTNKISAELQNDIMKVLRGETTQKVELPVAIMEAAVNASAQLEKAYLEEGYTSTERKREILRRNLNEGLEKCNCNPTTEMIVRYEEEATKPASAHKKSVVSEEKKEEATKPVVEEIKADPDTEIIEELQNFVNNLTKEDRRILRDLLADKN